jgi:hypothetical protein
VSLVRAVLALPGDDAPIEKEYRSIADAMMRCTRLVETFDASLYESAAVERVASMWKARMLSEYRSTSVFSEMVPQLMEANASLDAIGVVLRMAQDEVRHAEACGRAVAALGGGGRVEGDIDIVALARHRGVSSEERALRNVIYGCCLSEVVNCARLVDALDTMSDPYLRDVTRRLLSDETLHGQFGFHYLDAWRDWLVAHPDALRSIERFLRHGFAVLERQLSGTGAPPKSLTDDDRALGLPDPARLPDTFYQTVAGAIVPGLERYGIDATTAWKDRARAA